MSPSSNRQASIDSRRIALEREVTIRVPRFDTFVTEYSTNISTTGMFIVSEKPHAPGTTFTFEFSVADDWKLIRGKAQVVWTRYRNEDKQRPAGMGVRFVELDAQSRRLIRWIVEKHIREGGTPFELDELRNVIDEALGEAIDGDEAPAAGSPAASRPSSRSRPAARRPPAAKRRSSERNMFPLVVTAAVVVLGMVFLFWLTEWIPDRKAASGRAVASAAVDDTSPPTDANPAGPASDGAEDALLAERSADPVATTNPDSSPSRSEVAVAEEPRSVGAPPLGSAYIGVRQALARWSTAWSAQDVEGYVASYSREFRPPGSSRAAWEALRRERLMAPEFIKVSISRLDMVRVRDDLVEASVFQTYRSDRFSDSIEKVFELVWEEGTWKILSERSR